MDVVARDRGAKRRARASLSEWVVEWDASERSRFKRSQDIMIEGIDCITEAIPCYFWRFKD